MNKEKNKEYTSLAIYLKAKFIYSQFLRYSVSGICNIFFIYRGKLTNAKYFKNSSSSICVIGVKHSNNIRSYKILALRNV